MNYKPPNSRKNHNNSRKNHHGNYRDQGMYNSHEEYSENSDYGSDSTDNNPGINICDEHNKELDMICMHDQCQSPVCSKCLLAGNHKNHPYKERSDFFANLETTKRQIMTVEENIKKTERAIVLNSYGPLDLLVDSWSTEYL